MVHISPSDTDIIRAQIGREPQGIVRIAARAANGIPLVLQMRSMVAGKPFPTLYWLSCKDLSRAIGTLETTGLVKELEQRIAADEVLREKFFVNHQQYVAKRDLQMTAADTLAIKERGFSEMFEKYGIGGISQWDKVRCLHMQYAHHLVDGNVIGELMDTEFKLHLLLENQHIK